MFTPIDTGANAIPDYRLSPLGFGWWFLSQPRINFHCLAEFLFMPYKDKAKRREHNKLCERIRRLRNPAAFQAAHKRYQLKHAEKRRARARQLWREQHAERLTRQRLYQAKTRPQQRKYSSDYYYRNRAECIAHSIAWQKSHPERTRVTSGKASKRYNQKKPWVKHEVLLRRRARIRATADKNVQSFLKRVKSKRFSKCFYCNLRIPTKNVHIDHVPPLAKDGAHEAGNLCVSCAKCNLSKNQKLLKDWAPTQQTLLPL